MPIDPTTAGLITGATSTGLDLLQNAINTHSTNHQNSLNRSFAIQMYDKQRTDALTDRDFTNLYNSPAAQMERLKAAGLNPNLVYGNGAAQQQSSPVRPSTVPDAKGTPAQVNFSGASTGISEALRMVFQLANTQAQTDNLRANHETIEAETRLKNAQAGLTSQQETTETYKQGQIDAERRLADQSLRTNSQLSDIMVSKAKLENLKLQADTQFTLDQNERAEALKSMSLQEAAARIMNMRYQNAKTDAERLRIGQEIQNLKTDNTLKSQDIELKNRGIQPHDNMFMRMLGLTLNRLMPDFLNAENQ